MQLARLASVMDCHGLVSIAGQFLNAMNTIFSVFGEGDGEERNFTRRQDNRRT